MRLYEFTDPNKYLLPETRTADLVEQIRNVETDDKPDTVRRRPKKLAIKRLTETL
jgi:hypothetical protein